MDETILTGIEAVDNDHKSILNHINDFMAEIEKNENTSSIHDSYRRLEAAIYRHLSLEEKMLKAIGYEKAHEHAEVHDNLTDQLESIWYELLVSPGFQPQESARKWLETWLFSHVRTDDFLYRDWIFGAGLEKEAEAQMLKRLF